MRRWLVLGAGGMCWVQVGCVGCRGGVLGADGVCRVQVGVCWVHVGCVGCTSRHAYINTNITNSTTSVQGLELIERIIWRVVSHSLAIVGMPTRWRRCSRSAGAVA
jgi:hypothetical protein